MAEKDSNQNIIDIRTIGDDERSLWELSCHDPISREQLIPTSLELSQDDEKKYW